jgi:hypothetical protein
MTTYEPEMSTDDSDHPLVGNREGSLSEIVKAEVVLRRNLPRKSLGHYLFVLHDEGVGADFETIVCCLGRTHNVGGVALDLLPEQLAWLTGNCGFGSNLNHVGAQRLGGCFALTLSGLRREEVGGLRWSDIDLEAGVLRIRQDSSGDHFRGLCSSWSM